MKTGRLLALSIVIAWWQLAGKDAPRAMPQIPKVWDEAALADWATPIAGLNVRPTTGSRQDRESSTKPTIFICAPWTRN